MGLFDRLKQALGAGGPPHARIVGGAAFLRDLVEDVLEEEGWQLVSEGRAAFAIVFAEEGTVEDTRLPEDVGPDVRVLLVGPSQLPIELVARLAETVRGCGWLGAPFTREELLDEVRRCVALSPHEAAEFRRGLREDEG